MQVGDQRARLGGWRLLWMWTKIGLQSFGGGASTIFLIQREFVEAGGWMTMEEFTQAWNLCIMTPGINLVALTILIGRKLGGVRGIGVSLLGLLLPSATITCLIAAGFEGVERFGATQAVLRGVIPATAGVMLLVGLRFAQPQVEVARKEGWMRVVVSLVVVVVSFVSIAVVHVAAVLVLPGAGLVGAVVFTRWVKGSIGERKEGEASENEKYGKREGERGVISYVANEDGKGKDEEGEDDHVRGEGEKWEKGGDDD